jgi:hypothetical protein
MSSVKRAISSAGIVLGRSVLSTAPASGLVGGAAASIFGSSII